MLVLFPQTCRRYFQRSERKSGEKYLKEILISQQDVQNFFFINVSGGL